MQPSETASWAGSSAALIPSSPCSSSADMSTHAGSVLPPPPAGTAAAAAAAAGGGGAVPPALSGAGDATTAAASSAAAAPQRHVFGSLEGQLRAQVAAPQSSPPPAAVLAVPSAAAAAAAPRVPVSFNNRTTLLSTATHGLDASSSNAAPAAKVLSDTVRAGMAAGNINVSSLSAETFALSAGSLAARDAQAAAAREAEIAKRARSVVVPTNDNLVRKKLREIGEPITLFGERIPGRRERLSGLLARRAVEEAHAAQLAAGGGDASMGDASSAAGAGASAAPEPAKEAKAFLTPGTEELLQARLAIARYSLPRAAARLDRERAERELDNQDAATGTRAAARAARVARISKLTAFSSEIGDARPLASLAFSPCSTRLATASWSGLSKVWRITPATTLAYELKGHTGNVTDIAWRPSAQGDQPGTASQTGPHLASCGMDGNVLLWSLPEDTQREGDNNGDTEMTDASTAANGTSSATSTAPTPALPGLPTPAAPFLAPTAVLKGHTERCSRIAWHPSGSFLASSSFDKSWRLWDVSQQKEVLRQPGHAEAVYALAFHPDGSLLCSGDLGGIGHLWDLRSGKSVVALKGHAKQMLSCDFHPLGSLLATASDDHTVRIWDLRAQAHALYTLPAHQGLISNVRWEPREGLFLLTSSYDSTSKIWHGRDFTLIKSLVGHEGKVMRAEIAPNGAFVATSGYDRTWKLYAYED